MEKTGIDEHRQRQLEIFLAKMRQVAEEYLREDPHCSAMEALQYAANVIEGEMQGY